MIIGRRTERVVIEMKSQCIVKKLSLLESESVCRPILETIEKQYWSNKGN